MLELIELTETPDHQSLQNKINNHVRYLESYGDEGEFADLSNLKIENFDFSNCKLSGIHAHNSVFIKCRFYQCDLYGSVFKDSVFMNIDFEQANLGKTEFYSLNHNELYFLL